MKISAVINTHNEEKNITCCLSSIASYVDEIVLVDMESTDRTRELAQKFTDKIWRHDYKGYVEPARNFALSKATGEWTLIIDADEVMQPELGRRLKELAEQAKYTYYRLSRRNLIFGKWLRHSGWWPDYQIRFFQRGTVSWSDEIHSLPVTEGVGMDLQLDEKNALLHYHYESVEQYLERLNRYTSQEARQLKADGYQFTWNRVIWKPANEFLTRFFVWEGYKDGLHGLVLSLLQAFSFLIVELKVWESERFKDNHSSYFLEEVGGVMSKIRHDFCYWYYSKVSQRKTGFTKFFYTVRAKFGL